MKNDKDVLFVYKISLNIDLPFYLAIIKSYLARDMQI